MTNEIMTEEFLKERHRVLVEMDIDAFWENLKGQGYTHRPSRRILLMSMHKARCTVTDIPEELKEESKKWLAIRGYSPEVGTLDEVQQAIIEAKYRR